MFLYAEEPRGASQYEGNEKIRCGACNCSPGAGAQGHRRPLISSSEERSAVQHRLLSQPLILAFSTVTFGAVLSSSSHRLSQRLSEALRSCYNVHDRCCCRVPLRKGRQSFSFPTSSKGHNKRTPADAGVLEYRYLMESYLSGRSLANCRKFTAIT